MSNASDVMYCSFCGKSQYQVKKLVSGPAVYICDECVLLCNEVLSEKDQDTQIAIASDGEWVAPKPESIFAELDQHVIGQQRAKKVLSVAVHSHYKRQHKSMKDDGVEIAKSNILLIGPSGSGKTLLAESLAKMLDVPFAIADATTLTEAGYVGEDVENIVRLLLSKCDYDVKKASKGIIYIDEIDKLSRKTPNPSITRDVSGEGVQQALLKLIEGTVASIPPHGGRKHPNQEMCQINTRDILFICGGAFAELPNIIRARTKGTSMGFQSELGQSVPIGDDDLFAQCQPQDLIQYGLIPEFVGRLPVVAYLQALSVEQLIQVMTEPVNCLVKQYQKLVSFEGCELVFEDHALKAIAELAQKRHTGARGLRSIIEQCLLDTLFELPSMPTVNKIVVHENVITKGEKPLYIHKKQSMKVGHGATSQED